MKNRAKSGLGLSQDLHISGIVFGRGFRYFNRVSIYTYTGASAISEVRFRYANDRPPEALLAANTGVARGQLATIRRSLENLGLQCIPVFADGRDVLQVAGFKNAEQFAQLLEHQGFAVGPAAIRTEENDNPKRSLSSVLKRTSLRGAGLLNMIGDVALLIFGIRKQNTYHIVAGGLYTAGAAAAALYGSVKPERQVENVLDRTAAYLKSQSVKVAPDLALYQATEQKHGGVLRGIHHFLNQNAASTMLGFYTAGAATMLVGGLNKRDAMGRRNPFDIAYGANSLALKTLSLSLPEKPKKDGAATANDPVSGAVHWFIDEPMRLFGIGSFASDALLAGRSILEQRRNPGKKLDYLMWTTTGTYLAADVLAAISSKDPGNADGKFSADQQRRIEAIVAETIARQPVEKRGELAGQIAGIISQRAEMQGNAESISRGIREQAEHIGGNPWAARIEAEGPLVEPQPVR